MESKRDRRWAFSKELAGSTRSELGNARVEQVSSGCSGREGAKAQRSFRAPKEWPRGQERRLLQHKNKSIAQEKQNSYIFNYA